MWVFGYFSFDIWPTWKEQLQQNAAHVPALQGCWHETIRLELHQDGKHAMWHSSCCFESVLSLSCTKRGRGVDYVNSIFGPCVGWWITVIFFTTTHFPFSEFHTKEQFFNILKRCTVLDLPILACQPSLSRFCLRLHGTVTNQSDRVLSTVQFILSRWGQLCFNHKWPMCKST